MLIGVQPMAMIPFCAENQASGARRLGARNYSQSYCWRSKLPEQYYERESVSSEHTGCNFRIMFGQVRLHFRWRGLVTY